MSISQAAVRAQAQVLRNQAKSLAGGLSDLAQRAATYHHIFQDSGRNHIFPLIAAHGALWARGYFQFGTQLGRWLSLDSLFIPEKRSQKLAALETFADAFRAINQLVCIDTYVNYHLVKRFGDAPELAAVIPTDLLAALLRVDKARQSGQELDDAEKREVFKAHFLNEQKHIVGPRLQLAVDAFNWKLMKWLALKPLVRFAYFPRRQPFWFRNFTSTDERIQRGLQAFDIAAACGWHEVEEALSRYQVLPEAFFNCPEEYFASLGKQCTTPA